MDNTPENKTQGTNTESTIFSAPKEHDDKPKKGSGRIKKIVAAFLSVAILIGGTVAVIKLIPVIEETVIDSDKSAVVTELSSDDFERVTLKNGDKTLVLVSSITEGKDSSTVTWTLEGYDATLIDSYYVKQTVSELASITALRKMKNVDSDYGFDKPKATAVFEGRGETKGFTITVGNESPDTRGFYLKTTLSETVYLVENTEIAELFNDDLHYALNNNLGGFEQNSDNGDYFADGSLSTYDTIVVSGDNFPVPMKVVKNDDDSYIGFQIITPMNRYAYETKDFLTAFGQGLTCAGIYSYDTSDASLKKFGLDNPFMTATITVGKESLTYKIEKVDETYAAVVCDGFPMIRKVALQNLPFIDDDATDYYYKTPIVENIKDVENIILESGGQRYEFKLWYETVKAESEGEEDEEVFHVSYGGKELDGANFKKYYMQLLGISSVDFTTKNISGAYDTVMTFKHNNGTKDTVIGFKKYSEQRWQYYIDDVASGLISSTDYSKLVDYTKKVAAGEKLDVA
ncbi:MAG: DUF4340 domain-containing protein [Clostridia bacterium]|nr:DUF4340 domain-containing protein [Clostridia bacterium]